MEGGLNCSIKPRVSPRFADVLLCLGGQASARVDAEHQKQVQSLEDKVTKHSEECNKFRKRCEDKERTLLQLQKEMSILQVAASTSNERETKARENAMLLQERLTTLSDDFETAKATAEQRIHVLTEELQESQTSASKRISDLLEEHETAKAAADEQIRTLSAELEEAKAAVQERATHATIATQLDKDQVVLVHKPASCVVCLLTRVAVLLVGR